MEEFIVTTEKDRQCTYNVTMKRVRNNHCCSGRAISITDTVCVCVFLTLFIQHLYYLWPVWL